MWDALLPPALLYHALLGVLLHVIVHAKNVGVNGSRFPALGIAGSLVLQYALRLKSERVARSVASTD
jgi:hypothetical protein